MNTKGKSEREELQDQYDANIDLNHPGMIYYGTSFEFLVDIDQNGLTKPRFRNEQYILVSVSGYRGQLPCEHPEIKGIANIFANKLHIAQIEYDFLNYYNGYANSITCIHGFGPTPHSHIHNIDGLSEDKNNEGKVTVVLGNNASKYLIKPDFTNVFEFMSLALHPYILKINPEDIVGYVISKENLARVLQLMKTGEIKQRKIWLVEDIEGKEWTPSESMKVEYYTKEFIK